MDLKEILSTERLTHMKFRQDFNQCVIDIRFSMILMYEKKENIANEHGIIDEETLRRTIVIISSNENLRRMFSRCEESLLVIDDDQRSFIDRIDQ